MFWIIRLYVTTILFACCYVTRWGKFGGVFCKQTNVAACRFQNECNKVEIALRVVQFWSEIKLVITNRTPASRSCNFVITRLISDQIARHEVQLPLLITWRAKLTCQTSMSWHVVWKGWQITISWHNYIKIVTGNDSLLRLLSIKSILISIYFFLVCNSRSVT